jgi:hypothetical protein
LKGEINKPVQVSDDEIEDDFDDTKDTGHDDETFAELDDLFPISRHSNKRPRPSSQSALRSLRTGHEANDDDFDEINDSSSPISDSLSSPPARSRTKNPKLGSPTPQLEPNRQLVNTELSAPESFEPLSEPQTPDQAHAPQNENLSSSIKTASVFQTRPRFILSANYTPASAATPATSTSESTRKKPTFVLPRSPSPDKEDVSSSDIPAPFSPVATRTLRRSGRPKSSGAAAAYVPGGMAEHLRDWIMEADMKRKVTSERQPHQKQNDARFSTIGRIDSCQNAFLKSSGPVMMVQMSPEVARKDEPSDSEPMAVLLLGVAASRAHANNTRQSYTARSATSEKLKPGEIIGIGAGLSWEIEVDSVNTNDTTHNDRTTIGHRVVPSSQSDSEGDLEDQEDEITLPASSAHSTRKTWLVAAEWDLLRQGDT